MSSKVSSVSIQGYFYLAWQHFAEEKFRSLGQDRVNQSISERNCNWAKLGRTSLDCINENYWQKGSRRSWSQVINYFPQGKVELGEVSTNKILHFNI